MKFLYLIRHAKSSWDDAATADFDRPLNTRGIRDAGEMAKRLSGKADIIDAIISSPALRAKSTAEKFIAAFEKRPARLIFERGLYLSPESFFVQLVCDIDNRFNTVAIVAHNPGITDFANTLTNVIKTDNIPTCGIFGVKAATDNWKNFSMVKKNFLFYDYPKMEN